MKRLLVAAGLALAISSVHAQEGPAPKPPAASGQAAEVRASIAGNFGTEDRGPHRNAAKARGKHAGDPGVIDHSMDTLIVEPTHSSIILLTPTPP